MERTGSPLLAALTASIAAGPLFLAFIAGASVFGRIVRGLPLYDGGVLSISDFFILSVPVGFLLSFFLNYGGTWLMIRMADTSDINRAPFAWSLVGGFGGLMIGVLSALEVPEMLFAFAATGASCAVICRCWIDWEPA